MLKVDQLIEKFKELKEELNKNVNMSYAGGTNTAGMPARMGTSGAQGGMYRSEEMDKQAVAPPATMNLSEDEDDDVKKQMISASPGGAQDMMAIKFEKNGQWRMDKVDPEENINIPHPKGKAKVMPMIGKGEGKETKHDRCAREVGAKGGVDNPHAVCVAAGVKPEKWKKSADEIIEKLEKHYDSFEGKNREANPKLRQSDLGPGGKIHMVEKCGTNEEAGTSTPHNKGKFKVMDMAKEKEEKHAGASGLPYSGKDKDIKKGEGCPVHKGQECSCMDKSKKGHIQGNESKGNDENKAPGRGTLSV